jgi:hypothetical protein
MKLRVGKRTRVIVDELREIIGPASNIRLLTQELSHEEIAALQTACNVYLSLHRSEGYGLNIEECLKIGKPTVATHWSANTEYGPHYPNYHAVTYRMVPYDDWLLHYEDAGFSWADASVAEAAQTLRTLRIESQAAVIAAAQ